MSPFSSSLNSLSPRRTVNIWKGRSIRKRSLPWSLDQPRQLEVATLFAASCVMLHVLAQMPMLLIFVVPSIRR